jgi:hypothetical protein
MEPPFALSKESAEGFLYPLYNFLQYIHKTDIEIYGLHWFDLSVGQTQPNSGFASYRKHGHGGIDNRVGDIHYRYVLQTSLETAFGRHGANWFRGCLDSNEAVQGKGNQLISNISEAKLQRFRDFSNVELNPLWQYFRTRPALAGSRSPSAGTHPAKMWNMKAVNAHAITRVRNTVQNDGIVVMETMIRKIIGLSIEYENMRDQVQNDGPHTFGNMFGRLIGVLAALSILIQSVEKYLKDADGKSDNGEVPPICRFGVASDEVLRALKSVVVPCEAAMDALPQIHYPKYVGADPEKYMLKEDSQPYLDVIESEMKKIIHLLYFDIYNPKAYETQEPKQVYRFAPDSVKLAL